MRRVASIAGALFFLAACSSSSSNGGASAADSGAHEKDAGVQAAADNCVKAGYMGNEKGVGAYCVPGKGCPSVPGVLLLCTADHDAPKNAWFCTSPCTDDTDCGGGAFCDHTSDGAGCVPLACGSPADAAAD